jgi:hypothetical protein
MNDSERWYESYPDFTTSQTEDEKIEALAVHIHFQADKDLGRPAIQLFEMLVFGIKLASQDSPYICEKSEGEHESDGAPYFQVIRGKADEYYVEFSGDQFIDKPQTPEQAQALSTLGFTPPNEISPNWHREFAADASVIDIAAIGAEGLIKGFDK